MIYMFAYSALFNPHESKWGMYHELGHNHQVRALILKFNLIFDCLHLQPASPRRSAWTGRNLSTLARSRHRSKACTRC